jgi:hypothetical protein
MTGELQIDYEALEQDARRGIVRTALLRVAAIGSLPGEHHFYIAFDTRAAGVVVSRRLKQKYPEEMTIVLQHQFSNLTVDDEKFEVTLSFGNVPERLIVPFRAIRVFFDPSVPYGLQFESSDLLGDEVSQRVPRRGAAEVDDRTGTARRPVADALAEAPGKLAKMGGSPKSRGLRADAAGKMPAASMGDGAAEPVGESVARRQPGRPKLVRSTPEQPANDAKVVELDKFRKK